MAEWRAGEWVRAVEYSAYGMLNAQANLHVVIHDIYLHSGAHLHMYMHYHVD